MTNIVNTQDFLKKYENVSNISLLIRINELEIEKKHFQENYDRMNMGYKNMKSEYEKEIKEIIKYPDKQSYQTYKSCYDQGIIDMKYFNDNGYPIEVLCEERKDILQALKETNRLCKNYNDNSSVCHCIRCG